MQALNVNREALDGIEGWLSDAARIFTQLIIAYQRENEWVSGALELGVFKGKYLSLLAQQIPDAPVVGVDAFLEGHGVLLSEEHRKNAERLILHNVRSVAGAGENVSLVAGYTSEIEADDLRRLCPSGYSFISVDAGHAAEEVEHDCHLADSLLTDHGVVALDDVYNAVCPGVAEGFIRYMTKGKRDLAPFATCGNKVFVCRPVAHSRFHELSHDLALNIENIAPDLSQTREILVASEQGGWSPKLCGFDVIPFV